MNNKEEIWINQGYQFFAYEGKDSLKIERLSRAVGKNKSSFYHLFADKDIFLERLLEFHLGRAKGMIQKEAEAQNESELIDIIIEHKTDLLFNRQMRIHRGNSDFERYLNEINAISLPALLPVWKEIIGLHEDSYLAQMVLQLSVENFYLQITEENLTKSWLSEYFINIRQMINHIQNKIKANK